LSQLLEVSKFCFYEEFAYEPQALKILEVDASKEIDFLLKRLEPINDFTKENLEKEFRLTAEKLELKLKALIHPVRVALMGRKDGPGLFETMEVLGKERAVSRLKRLLGYWENRR